MSLQDKATFNGSEVPETTMVLAGAPGGVLARTHLITVETCSLGQHRLLVLGQPMLEATVTRRFIDVTTGSTPGRAAAEDDLRE